MKAMKAKDSESLVLACNGTGSHTLSISIIGTAAALMCFKPPRPGFTLPYFRQKSAWMDALVHDKCFNTVFFRKHRQERVARSSS